MLEAFPDARNPGRSTVGQKIALGHTCKHQTVNVLVSETTLTVDCDDGNVRVIVTRPRFGFGRPKVADLGNL